MGESPWSRASNSELAAAIRGGDRSAEQVLADRLCKPLRQMLQVRRVAWADREDLMQETLLQVFRRLRNAELPAVDHVEAFVESVARNLWTADWRRNTRRDDLLQAHGELAMPASVPTPEATLDAAEAASMVRRSVGELRQPRDRQILRQHYFDDIDKAALCQQHRVSGPHFDRILFNARQRLRELVDRARRRSS